MSHPRRDPPVPFPTEPSDVERLTRLAGEIRMEWIDGRDVCGGCLGAGTRTYGDTSTWRRGCGGQAMTADVCDQCWGSGLAARPWPSRHATEPATTWGAGPADPRTTPLGLARELGIPCSPGTRSPVPSTPEERLAGWPWDGTTLHGLDHQGRPHDTHLLWHEIGHWLCAEPHLRGQRGFGAWTAGQEAAAHLVGELLRHASDHRGGPPPTLHDAVDPVALARATALLERVGITYRRTVVLDVSRLARKA